MIRSTPVFIIALVLVLCASCVERKLTITSQPSNALVYMNGREIGRTPIETDFLWYGNYDVQIRKEGYQTLKTHSRISAPWWQWVPIDLLAELMPWHPTDHQSLHYTLNPAPASDKPVQTLIERATEMKSEIEGPVARRP
ncbi:MAG: hypothetical protein KatS3mg104_0263 [Phycisphaerae bacterium]|jgi:hypothetical protein|nr:MAG: hypothetical protein KatS3mg104_0263 [Phycisphaerae bacterium]